MADLRTKAIALIAFLKTIKNEDRERAQKAIEIIESDTAHKNELALSYSLGPKGIHDWIWSQENRTNIEKLTE